jgi:hypothetical protein
VTAAFAKTGIPQAPDVRPAADELREITVAVVALASACLLAGVFL